VLIYVAIFDKSGNGPAIDRYLYLADYARQSAARKIAQRGRTTLIAFSLVTHWRSAVDDHAQVCPPRRKAVHFARPVTIASRTRI
jgi:hypothetical protein